jgi:hypothetical protein
LYQKAFGMGLIYIVPETSTTIGLKKCVQYFTFGKEIGIEINKVSQPQNIA